MRGYTLRRIKQIAYQVLIDIEVNRWKDRLHLIF